MSVQIPLDSAVLYDIEVYKNFFLVAFQFVKSGKVVKFEMYDGVELDRAGLKRIAKNNLLVGFNNLTFDNVLLWMAIHGATNEELKDAADAIINENLRSWEAEKRFNTVIGSTNQIDLIEVAPGQASLKIYNGRLHGKRMQDLPIEPSAILTRKEMEETATYCVNDLAATGLLFKSLREQLELRITMTREYGVDLRSKSDAQVAEAVIKKQLEQQTGKKPKAPEFRPGARFKYRVPDFIEFENPELKNVVRMLRRIEFKVDKGGSPIMPTELADALIAIGGSRYQMGMGGLHSTESATTHRSDKRYVLLDRDVASYYPAIILNLALYPPHLGRAFLKVYRAIVERRLEAKKSGNKVVAESLKITINGSFGKFGSKWSALYSPDLLLQVTLTGQLSLLMLIERIEARGIEVVSANTDGIVIKCPRNRESELAEIFAKWEADTNFVTEETRYASLHSRDVNSYIAIKEGGGAKTKGAFAIEGFQKNPTNIICVEAVIAFLEKGAPIADTVRGCLDITKFVTVRTVRGGAVKDGRYLGKAIRWYYATDVDGEINYKLNGNKVPRSEGAAPLMTLPDEFPDDIDYDWYIRECEEMLMDIGYHYRPRTFRKRIKAGRLPYAFFDF